MDDADVHENMGEDATAVDERHDREKNDGDVVPSDQTHLDPSRWWFTSAAFPMIAGTLGPVASAFSICALVKNWRQHINPGSDVTKAVFIPDPPWLYAVNGVQLFIAIMANVFLLLNMTKRVRFVIAQPITIVGWYISAILLVALCATAGGPLIVQPEIEYVWSQAFYYGLFAAILYFIVASLMVVNVWGALKGHYAKDFELTTSQRTLMLQTILFLGYLLLGALVFSHIEGWSYLDAVYWADVTLFTIGFGDFSPSTEVGRGLLIPYTLIGIISLGLVIGSIRSLMLDKGKHRLDARMLEKKRRQMIRKITRSGKGKLLEPINDDSFDYYPESKGPELPHTEFERRQKEFNLMRKIQNKASRTRRWSAMAISTTTWAVLWLVGSKIFQVCEEPYQGWSYFDGVYFSFTALTTLGNGDLTPVSNQGKAFFVFWSLLALPTQTVLISNAGDTIVKVIRDGTLRLGSVTILPGESGFKKDTKQLLAKLSFGVLFAEERIEESPPGFFGFAQRHEDTEEEEDGEESSDSHTNKGAGNRRPKPKPDDPAKRGRAPSKPKQSDEGKDLEAARPKRETSTARKDVPTELPKTRSEYHLVLIDEIRRVTRHLEHSPPRKYTYKEWAWYLRLIDEDESSAETHRKPVKVPRGKDEHPAVIGDTPNQDGGADADVSVPMGNLPQSEHGEKGKGDPRQQKLQWSWVGHRSPLMDTREEAEWILEKLEAKLCEELRAVVKEQAGRDSLKKVSEEERRNEQKGLGPTPMQ
ncbi:Uu.00g127420.m01.CDS01 [Anthostomella pinea]|uniref:Uu.00g127420.m01.CDS01 n=1 Tax=Anthostomella pinea TaxID=933095 RepID=A0AAI8VI25_9PEZI|nr:Uu.00g127420.m01.CDS01 [Anthostomella pinea]